MELKEALRKRESVLWSADTNSCIFQRIAQKGNAIFKCSRND